MITTKIEQVMVKNISISFHKAPRDVVDVLKKTILRHIYILQWLPKYNKIDAISDLVAGVTLGLTMVSQSIAYVSLAGLPPQYGLYTAFMGSFAYSFFGTIKEVCIGPTASISLLTFIYTDGLNTDHVILLSFLSGLFVFLMGLFNLGFIVDFISIPVTTAFTSATSILIASSQLKGLFGLSFTSKGIFDMYVKLFQNISDTKMPDFFLGFTGVIFLVVIKQICQKKVKNPGGAKALWLLSIGKNALLVSFCSTIAFCFHRFNGSIPFAVSGDIQPGLPPFRLPSFSTVHNNETISFFAMVRNLGPGYIVIPLVSVFQNIAIAKAFTAGVVVDSTHEMMTLGICNMLGSLVSAIPASGAFSRSAVSNSSGVRTPFAGLYAATIILMTLSFLTPYLYYIPKATLAAVLITAVAAMIDYESIPKLWRCNKLDLVVNLTTLFVGLFCGVEIGLITGIAVNMTGLLKIWTRPRIDTNHFADRKGQEYLVIKPELGLYFPAVDYFTECITKATINTTLPVAIDFTHIYRIDYSGCMTLKTLIANFQKQLRELYFFNIQPNVFKKISTIIEEDKINIDNDLNNLEMVGLCIKEAEKPLMEICYTNNKETNNK